MTKTSPPRSLSVSPTRHYRIGRIQDHGIIMYGRLSRDHAHDRSTGPPRTMDACLERASARRTRELSQRGGVRVGVGADVNGVYAQLQGLRQRSLPLEQVAAECHLSVSQQQCVPALRTRTVLPATKPLHRDREAALYVGAAAAPAALCPAQHPVVVGR
eukprot:CAMPEP_0119386762 /NCGR_PEP_ID=MMETSP1334-20130426/97552_1 /TAXON_ID=127549 /ORGANISM="Calcidiscus leptoporus, Strain RCC1130" /LENGTH=158 /DNA_ID=CAMNT_0007408327 /DNA_START=62 /DNA_END=535 /DNA_ORIENTATION=+